MLHKYCVTKNIAYEWFFPVRGHSYMPADRAFGLLEKKLRKKEKIILPTEYDCIVSSIGNLHIVGQNVVVADWNSSVGRILRTEKGFKITDAKVIGLDLNKPNDVTFQAVYTVPPTFHKVLKKNLKFSNAPLALQ